MINIYDVERKMNEVTNNDKFYQEYLSKYNPSKEDALNAFRKSRERSRARKTNESYQN